MKRRNNRAGMIAAVLIAAGLVATAPGARGEEPGPSSGAKKGPACKLKPLEANWRPANGKSTLVFKSTPQGDLKINLFFPQDWKAANHRPCIIFFFGGGFVGGDPSQYTTTAEYFAGRGMTAATVEYRIRGKHHTGPEEGIEDAKSAVRWLRTNARSLGIDPRAIIAAGGSSGGTCSALAAYCADYEPKAEDLSVSSRPDALVLYFPHLGFPSGPKFVAKNSEERKIFAFFSNWKVNRQGSPAVIFMGTEDLLMEKARAFAEQMIAAGNRAELYTAKGQKHGFCGDRPGGNPWHVAVVQQTDLFLASLGYLQGKPTISMPANTSVTLKKELP